jgi:exopolysaccharide biosynthesis polyprenyl glycosylphosphotransferase
MITWVFHAKRREMVHAVMLVVLDSIAMVVAFQIGRLIRGSSDRPFANVMSESRYTSLVLASIPLWIIIFAICGLYEVQVIGGRVSEASRVVAAVCGGVMLLTSLAYLSYDVAIFPSRSVPLFALMIGIPLIIAGRQVARSVMRRFFAQGHALRNVILVGTGLMAARIADKFARPRSGYRVLAAVGPTASGAMAANNVKIYPTLESAVAASSGARLDEIVQADLEIAPAEATRLMEYAIAEGLTYRFVPDKYGVYAANSKIATIDGIPVMEVRLTCLDGWGAVGKRAFDVVGATALLIVLAPVLLAVAIVVKLTEPGAPVLYTQGRIGLGGRPVGVIKFRTMRWKYSTGPDREFKTAEDAFVAMGRADLIPDFQRTQKVANDPRVSKLGAFLRKSSLDELPQLFNAVRGELSLVGPRPITQQELDRYGPQVSSFLALKPGITGLWQVYGRSSTTYDERVKLDIYYVENWSLGMDVSILARTLVSVAARRGAV